MVARFQRYKWRKRREKPKLVVLTSGQTECNYFRKFPVPGELLIVNCHGGISNKKLVEKAQSTRDKLKGANKYQEDLDEVWVVIDRDTHSPNPRDGQQFSEALEAARDANINVAYSNQAFELWYLLHFKLERDGISAQELELRLVRELKKLKMGGYEKPAPEMYDLLLPRVNQAMDNAEKLLRIQAEISPADANPSTTVHELVKKLRWLLQKGI